MTNDILTTPSFSLNDVTIIEKKTVYHGFAHIQHVTLKHRLFEDNTFCEPLHRELVHRPQAAGVLLYDHENQLFALIEQFRIGAIDDPDSAWQLEVVAGLIDEGETPEQAAIREAFEEAGVNIGNLEPLFDFYPSAGGCNEFFYLFAANTDLSQMNGIFGAANEGENIRLHVLTYQNIKTLLMQRNRLKNSPVIIALQWLYLQIN